MPHPATAASPALPESPPSDVTAGLDWATTDHAVAVVNSKGAITEQFAVDATGAGCASSCARLHRAGVGEVAIERGDGQVVDTLLGAGMTVVVISPNQVHSLRGRYGTAGNKDDRFDAFVLADALRTDRARLRPLIPDTSATVMLRLVVRARKDLLAHRVGLANQLRAHLEFFHPGPVRLFADLDGVTSLRFLTRFAYVELVPRHGRLRRVHAAGVPNARRGVADRAAVGERGVGLRGVRVRRAPHRADPHRGSRKGDRGGSAFRPTMNRRNRCGQGQGHRHSVRHAGRGRGGPGRLGTNAGRWLGVPLRAQESCCRRVRQAMNRIPKVVVSRSAPALDAWSNSSLLECELVAGVADLTREQDVVVVVGSTSVVHALTAADAVDEYRLLVIPTALGAGERLFVTPVDLQLTSIETVGQAVLARYDRAPRA